MQADGHKWNTINLAFTAKPLRNCTIDARMSPTHSGGGGNAVLQGNKLIRIYVCVNVRVTNAQIFTLFSWTRWTNFGTLTISDPINGHLVL